MGSYLALCLLTAILLSCGGADALTRLLRRGRYGLVGAPHTPEGTDLPPDQWFTQQLDHFDPTNNQTWQQRYNMVTDFYTVGGPAFLMIEGEGESNPGWLTRGYWKNYAKEYNAIMFQLEHRFYGKSQPTSDLSVENLRYLSSEQALADAAYFITGMNSRYNLSEGTKWILFGGSYAGNLAAWARLKYPHLIHGAMSASGPVLAKVDFNEYMDVVRSSLETYVPTFCAKAVRNANRNIMMLLKHVTGREIINRIFRLCEPIDVTKQNDVYNLLESLADNLAYIVQYNKDNRQSPTWNYTIDTMCDTLTNLSSGNNVERYAEVNSHMLEAFGQPCLSYSYDSMIEVLRNTSWEASEAGRQWLYQTCTEFGYFQTSENKSNEFFNEFPLFFFINICSDVFGDRFDIYTIENGVQRTNIMYGGLDLRATRIVYVHGSIDPWHKLGIIDSKITESPSIFINGTAHCANMYPPSDSDSPDLLAARQQVGYLIGQWLLQEV